MLLGETHGALVNPKIIEMFVKKLEINIVIIELEKKWNVFFPLLIKNENQFLQFIQKEKWICESGVIGKEHIILFQKLMQHGIKILPIKIENKNWNVAEQKTVKYITSILKKYPNKNVLGVIGKLHARKKPFSLKENGKKRKYIPLGSILHNASIHVRIRYQKGTIYNFGSMTIKDDGVKNREGLFVSRSPFFDYDFCIRTTRPIHIINTTTN